MLKKFGNIIYNQEHPNRYVSKVSKFAEKSYWSDNESLEDMIGEEELNNLLIIHSWDNIDATELIKLSYLCVCPFSSLAIDTCLSSNVLITGPYSQHSNIADEVLPIAKDSNFNEYVEIVERNLKEVENNINKKIKAIDEGRKKEIWPKLDCMIENSLHALPFFKIDRESLCIQGSKYNIGEAIFEYISQERDDTFTQMIARKLVQENREEEVGLLAKKGSQLTGDEVLCKTIREMLGNRLEHINQFKNQKIN